MMIQAYMYASIEIVTLYLFKVTTLSVMDFWEIANPLHTPYPIRIPLNEK